MKESKQWGSAPRPAEDKSPDPILLTTLLALTLSACTIHHVLPYTPETQAAPETADATSSSTNCFEASTTTESLACTDPTIGALNRELTRTLQFHLRTGDLFARDALLAAQRFWLLALPATCRLPTAAEGTADRIQSNSTSAASRIKCAPKPPPSPPGTIHHAPRRPDAIAQYVHFKPAAGAESLNPAFCASLARDANTALSRTGRRPRRHRRRHRNRRHARPRHRRHRRPPRRRYITRRQRLRRLPATRRAITFDATPPALDSLSLGKLLQSTAENNGARFSAYASQTGDYGTADVFQDQNHLTASSPTPGVSTPLPPPANSPTPAPGTSPPPRSPPSACSKPSRCRHRPARSTPPRLHPLPRPPDRNPRQRPAALRRRLLARPKPIPCRNKLAAPAHAFAGLRTGPRRRLDQLVPSPPRRRPRRPVRLVHPTPPTNPFSTASSPCCAPPPKTSSAPTNKPRPSPEQKPAKPPALPSWNCSTAPRSTSRPLSAPTSLPPSAPPAKNRATPFSPRRHNGPGRRTPL